MITGSEIAAAITRFRTDHLGLLKACGGYYDCPKEPRGKRLGPMVAYRGEYEPDKRFIGDVYVNFAMAEQFPTMVRHFGSCLAGLLHSRSIDADVFCGAPEGGKSLADKVAMSAWRQYGYPEKKDGGLQWGRHAIQEGRRVVVIEDICNNFSTTSLMVDLILRAGGVPVAIACFLNRSLTVNDLWKKDDSLSLPVVALVRKEIHEYRQDDPDVMEDVKAGNVVWNVKSSWSRLEQAMRDAQA